MLKASSRFNSALNSCLSRCSIALLASRDYSNISDSLLTLSPEVQQALADGSPLVALESTIISHGMPFPRNIQVALDVELAVRNAGAIPATIAIIHGKPKVGLSQKDIEFLADNSSNQVLKASRRDLAYVMTKQLHAATTVASTMIIAHTAGIRIFATGGIGGVHRGAEETFDVSADLYELGKTNVTVVCAGVKSILDIPKTLEVLETQGVPVIGYQCKHFPAFYTNDSGILSPMVVDDSLTIAKMILASENLSLSNGMVVGVPNPAPADSMIIQGAIEEAIRLAHVNGISGQAVTPFILQMVERLTQGKSLDANVSLILNNAVVAADIAKDHARLRSSAKEKEPPRTNVVDKSNFRSAKIPGSDSKKLLATFMEGNRENASKKIICFGGAVIDMIGRTNGKLIPKSSNPGHMRSSFGGVGRNIAEQLGKNNFNVFMVGVVGDDLSGQSLLNHARSVNIKTNKMLVLPDDKTASYSAIHDIDGDLCVGIADMDIMQKLTADYITSIAGDIRTSHFVVSDGNLSPQAFTALTNITQAYFIPLFFEPTSNHKCLLPVLTGTLSKIDIMKPNVLELETIMRSCLERGVVTSNKASITRSLDSMAQAAAAAALSTSSLSTPIDIVDVRILACGLLQIMNRTGSSINYDKSQQQPTSFGPNLTLEGIHRRIKGKHVVVSMGSLGVLWCGPKEVLGKDADTVVDEFIACRHVSALAVEKHQIHHTNGAGDALGAGILAALLSADSNIRGPTLQCIQSGITAARDRLINKEKQ